MSIPELPRAGGSHWAEAEEFTFGGELSSALLSVAVLDAAVIEALVLLAGLEDGHAHHGVVSCSAVGDMDVGKHHRSEAAL